MTPELSKLVEYRMNEARETLGEARDLHGCGKYRGAINRSYYAMFYAAWALLIAEGLESRKHSGVIGLFHREFVKPSLFPASVAKYLDRGFEMRNRMDYHEVTPPTEEQSATMLSNAQQFIEEADRVLASLSD